MRAFVIWSLTIALAAFGGVLDVMWAVSTDGPAYPVLTLGLGLVGLLLGLLVARLALPRQRPLSGPACTDPACGIHYPHTHRLDLDRYPNRVIRHR